MVQENDDVSEDIRIANLISAETRGRDRSTPNGFACPREIHIMPFMYGVVSSKDTDLLERFAPEFPAHLKLGRQLTEVSAPDAHTRYAVRMMRTGHIYVFAKRNTVQGNNLNECWGLDGHFECDKNHNLRFIDEAGHQPRVRYSQAYSSYFSIHNPMDVHELRILFTPVALTVDMIQAVLEDEELRNKIQQFDINTLLKNEVFQDTPPDDTLRMQDVTEVVTEIRAHKFARDNASNPNERKTYEDYIHILLDQFFPHTMVHYRNTQAYYENAGMERILSVPDALARSVQRDPKLNYAAGIVLEDAIGITQALNNWRNDALESYYYTSFLNKKTKVQTGEGEKDVTNKWLLNGLTSYENISKNYGLIRCCADVKGAWQSYDSRMQRGIETYEAKLRQRRNLLRGQESIRERMRTEPAHMKTHERQLIFQQQQLQDNEQAKEHTLSIIREEITQFQQALQQAYPRKEQYQQHFNEHLNPLVDLSRKDSIKQDYETSWVETMKAAQERIPAHIAWLQHEVLRHALDLFDNSTVPDAQNPDMQVPSPHSQGIEFAAQVGLCTMGIEGLVEAYTEIFDNWWEPLRGKGFDTQHNLLLRAYCCNDPQTLEAVQQMNVAVQDFEDYLDKNQELNWDAQSEEQKLQVPEFRSYISATRKACSYFKKIFEMKPLPEGHLLAGMQAVVAQLQNRLLTYGSSNRLEYSAFAFFRNLSVAQIGDEVAGSKVALHYSGLNNHNRPRRVLTREIQHRWDKSYNRAANFARMRMASIILVMDVVNLIALLFKDGKTEADYIKIYSAAMTSLGSLVSYYTTILQHSLGSYELAAAPANHKKGFPASQSDYKYHASRVRYANFKLIGATLSTFAQIPGQLYEGYQVRKTLIDAYQHENWILTGAYGLQQTYNIVFATVNLVRLYGAVHTALLTAAQYETFNAVMTQSLKQAVGKVAARTAATNAARGVVVRGALGAAVTGAASTIVGFNPIGLGILALVTLIGAFANWYDRSGPLEMDVWLKRFILRNAATRDGKSMYDTQDNEVKYLARALNTLSGGVPVDVFHQEFIVNAHEFINRLDQEFDEAQPAQTIY